MKNCFVMSRLRSIKLCNHICHIENINMPIMFTIDYFQRFEKSMMTIARIKTIVSDILSTLLTSTIFFPTGHR